MDRLPTGREIMVAALPKGYIEAKKALRACAKQFTPERYAKAVVALGDAQAFEEDVAGSDRDQLATYTRIADDREFERLVKAVMRKRRAWTATYHAHAGQEK
jgi:hypothetical protein